MKLKRVRSNDLASLSLFSSRIPLLARYGWTARSAKKILGKALKDRDSDLLAAVEASRILGFTWVMRRAGFARSAYLRLIVVDADSKRSGVGTRLMRAMERRHLKPNGLLLLTTTTNKPARAFYEALGYRKAGVLKDYVRKGLTEIVYFKPGRPARLKK